MHNGLGNGVRVLVDVQLDGDMQLGCAIRSDTTQVVTEGKIVERGHRVSLKAARKTSVGADQKTSSGAEQNSPQIQLL